jgi:hypothetical protein
VKVSDVQTALSQQDNYIIGPVVELRLPFGFAFETGGLYRGTQYHVANASNLPTAIQSSSWEIPYLGKFRFPIPLLKPFVVAGGAYRTFDDLPPGVTASHNGAVAGAVSNCEYGGFVFPPKPDTCTGAHCRRTTLRASPKTRGRFCSV